MIVTASDRMLSYNFTSAESALKVTRIHHPLWIAMLAGDDIAQAEDVIRFARGKLQSKERPTVDEVLPALYGACQDAKNRKAHAAVLAPLGIDLQTFYDTGRDKLGEGIFAQLIGDIQIASALPIELLVLGFEHQGVPALLKYDDLNHWREFTRAGYAAIGSGSTSAETSLSFHDYQTTCSSHDAVYQVCAAKFMSEKAGGIGKETWVVCIKPSGETCFIVPKDTEPIRNIWDEQGKPRPPRAVDVNSVVEPLLGKTRWTNL